MPDFYEFFAGGGMARAGLGAGWTCTFANDFSPMKADAYCKNWGQTELLLGDINDVTTDDLPASRFGLGVFPCQDLSLAGKYPDLGIGHLKTELARERFGRFGN
jgi:DNA (cytosine-5)-methyltransferase 1